MRHILVIFAMMICNLSFSQLSVRNTSYVFINDEIVFVEDDINLNEAASTIYLRSEAQVIQGSGTIGNSGVGELSVYQEANAGEHEYNYWCSPIGSKTSNNINNPFGISFLNDVTGLITSTPATYNSTNSYNGTSSPLNIEPHWVWKFIASDNYGEWIHVKGNTTINPGEGYTMKGTIGSANAQRYDFRGKPNTGTIGVSVATNQFTLVGNPYPSALDALAYIHDVENASVINGTLYYWEQDQTVNSHYINAYNGGYATYTIDATGLVETFIPAVFNTYDGNGSVNVANTGIGTKTARRYIPIGQGFMVEGTANGVVKAKNSHRSYVKESAANSEFFKSSGDKKSKVNQSVFSIIPEAYKRFRLNIDFNDLYTRQLVQTFHPTATDGFDYGLESKINAADVLSSDAYWTINNDSYLAEALTFNEELKIPLVIKVAEESPIRIRIADIQNFTNSQSIYVHDIENETYVDLKEQDFEVYLERGKYNDRFEITFTEQLLSNTESSFETFKILHNNTAILKIINKNNIELTQFQLYDILGKLILNDKLQSSNRKQTYSTSSLSNGVYIAKVTTAGNQIISKKIIVANKK
ncbi:T9SS type A sorting domain-containing protein [Algibacter luteus]|uniref:Por secretion system C-terminal sorting domain-containing protein n=1 Tax=Algibacter luteus TaxID=1178825 RepID=A0A1M6C309_9FLAO|nr:T9SS type A sorting domain-containing protein [Algibacter luteus]SHI55435.1 Por secretion system C-terminal sorting domain-containing protein [Algibacter luteus]